MLCICLNLIHIIKKAKRVCSWDTSKKIHLQNDEFSKHFDIENIIFKHLVIKGTGCPEKNRPQVNGSETVIFTPNSLNLCMLITKWLNDTHTKFQVNRFTNKRFMGCWSARTILSCFRSKWLNVLAVVTVKNCFCRVKSIKNV